MRKGNSRKTKCPHLANWLHSVCEARLKPYTPSSFQVHAYCKNEQHRKCPFYMGGLVEHGEQACVY